MKPQRDRLGDALWGLVWGLVALMLFVCALDILQCWGWR